MHLTNRWIFKIVGHLERAEVFVTLYMYSIGVRNSISSDSSLALPRCEPLGNFGILEPKQLAVSETTLFGKKILYMLMHTLPNSRMCSRSERTSRNGSRYSLQSLRADSGSRRRKIAPLRRHVLLCS